MVALAVNGREGERGTMEGLRERGRRRERERR